jgi:hypothetical protein
MFGNGPRLADGQMLEADIAEATTPQLVNAYADLKVWFAVNEVDRPVPGGQRRHRQLRLVVNELRERKVLD